MCRQECFGDYYRGCQHYVRHYYTGVTEDCFSPTCGLSQAHAHRTTRICPCPKIAYDNRRVVNMFQTRCDDCKELEREAARPYPRYHHNGRW